MELDEALALLGTYSRWHVLTFLFLNLTFVFPTCWHMLAIVFIGGVPYYHCNVPLDQVNSSIPLIEGDDGKLKLDQCHQFPNQTNASSNASVPCENGFSYFTDFESTIVMEWELVCKREYLKDLSQTIFVVGVMAGAIVFTVLADIYGRKPIVLFIAFLMTIAGIAQAFVTDYFLFLFFRFILGAFQQGMVLTGFVLCCEIFPADHRLFAGIILQVFWGAAMMVMAGMAYALRDWRDFELSISVPLALALLGYWFFPESFPWQVANGRIKDAEKTLKKIAKFNGIKDYPDHILTEKVDHQIDPRLLSGDMYGDDEKLENDEKPGEEENSHRDAGQRNPSVEKQDPPSRSLKDKLLCCKKQQDEPKEKKENICTIFRHPKLRLYMCIMCVLWFVNSLVYFGLNLSTGDLAGNRYINFLVSGFVESASYLSCYFVLKRFGRRKPLAVYHGVTGVSLIISVVVPLETSSGKDISALSIFFNMVGRFGIATSFATIFLYAGELVPVNIRNTGMGMCSVSARVAGMLAPFSSLLVRKVYWLPGTIFGVLSIIVGILALLLPETQGRLLPQTVDDIMLWDTKRGRAKSFDVHASMRKQSAKRRDSRRRSSAADSTNV